ANVCRQGIQIFCAEIGFGHKHFHECAPSHATRTETCSKSHPKHPRCGPSGLFASGERAKKGKAPDTFWGVKRQLLRDNASNRVPYNMRRIPFHLVQE